MILQFLINTVFSLFNSIAQYITIEVFSLVQFPVTIWDTLLTAVEFAFFILPAGILPIILFIPGVWVVKIIASVIHNLLEDSSNFPFFGWLS